MTCLPTNSLSKPARIEEEERESQRERALPTPSRSSSPTLATSAPFGWNYKPVEKHCWLIFCERKILFRLKKQAE
jgi:hypothetical protein